MSDFVFTLPAWNLFSSYCEEKQNKLWRKFHFYGFEDGPIYKWHIEFYTKPEKESTTDSNLEDRLNRLLGVLEVEDVVRWSFNSESVLVYKGMRVSCPYDFERAGDLFELAPTNYDLSTDEGADFSYAEAYHKIFDEIWKPTLDRIIAEDVFRTETKSKIDSLTKEVVELKECILALENQPSVQILCDCGRAIEVHVSESTKALSKHFSSICQTSF